LNGGKKRKPRTILLTGAAGFIGARTGELLLDEEKETRVIGVDNLNDYYDVRLKQSRLADLKGRCKNFEFMKIDIEDRPALERLFRDHRFDAVLNLAARAGVRYSLVNPYVYMTTNASGTLHLLEEMRKHDVPKMVLASTSSLYAGQKMPFREDLPVNEPISPYAASKKAAEAVAYAYHHLYGLDITILRYFTVYGPSGRPDMSVFRFIQRIDGGVPIELFGDGSQSRDFTYVDDIARGTIKAMKETGYEIINLGGNSPVAITTLIEAIESLLGKRAGINRRPFHKADLKETWADISKAKRLLDWEPTVPLTEGLARTVDWHRKNRRWLGSIEMEGEG
jgi:nucleoside-diphosphate-sugar epimerase